MNYAMIRYIIGWILNFEAAFMSPSFVVGLIYREKSAWAIFATMLLCLVIGVPMVLLKRPKQAVFYAKDGFVSVGLSWVVLSVMGALPFVISGSIPHPVDALFETVSGFTTTGSSILSDVEALPKCMLFWRALHSLGRRNGRAGLYADDPSDVRRLSHEPHAGGESGTLCGAFCSHGKVARPRFSMESISVPLCWSFCCSLWEKCRCLMP